MAERWFLEVDGLRVGEVEDFRMDEPPKVQVWGPVWPHLRQKAPDTCSFVVRGIPPQQGAWNVIVDEEGLPVHEIRFVHIDTRMALGGATNHVKAQVL
mgnify:CR=1 FL=1